jgi:hypothetical protein
MPDPDWKQVLGTPISGRRVPRPDLPWDEHGGGPGFDLVYTTPRLDWTFESRNVGRSDGHMASLIVTRNDTGLPWADGWTDGDEALESLMNAAMAELEVQHV